MKKYFSTRVFLTFVFVVICFNGVASQAVNRDERKTVDIAERAVITSLNTVENAVGKALEWTKSHRQVVKSVLGIFILFYGGQFAKSLLLLQALRVTGGPTISKSIEELKETYKRTRKIIKEEMPEIVRAKEDVGSLISRLKEHKNELRNLKAMYEHKVIDFDEYQKKSQVSNLAIIDIQEAFSKINAIQNSFSHIKEAVDPVNLKQILVALYQTFVVAVAGITSRTIATITIGIDMSKTVLERARKIFISFPKANVKRLLGANAGEFISTHADWVHSVSEMVSHGFGIMAAYLLEALVTTVSACSIGSNMLVNALEELLDPILNNLGLPTLSGSPQKVTLLQSVLLSLGIWHQLKPGGAKLPGILKILFYPITALELILTKMMLNNKLPM